MKHIMMMFLVMMAGLILAGCGIFCSEELPANVEPTNSISISGPNEADNENVPPEGIADTQLLSGQQGAIYSPGLISSEQGVLNKIPDLSHYEIELTIPPDLGMFEGRQLVRFTNLESVELVDLYFMLYPNYEDGNIVINEVTLNGQHSEFDEGPDRTNLRVPLLTPLLPGKSVEIEMGFSMTLPETMGGNYGLLGYFNDVLVLDTFYPVIPVYDVRGWHIDIPEGNGDLTYLDVSTYKVVVTAPEEMVLVSSGYALGQTTQGGLQTVTFVAGPSRDFYLAGSERYRVISRIVGETTINSYALEDYSEGAELALETATAAFEVFEARLGPYPYTEFDVISSPMLALGIEYPGIVGITLDIYDIEGYFGDTPAPIMLEGVIAHEAAHQWFYSIVGNDQVNEPWLDEALAQYMTWVYYLDVYGAGTAETYRNSWVERWNLVNQQDIPIGMPAEWYSGIEYGAIVYGRGPLFIEALAEEMGMELFNSFLRSYYEQYKWDTASGADFRKTAETVCDCDLDHLFAEWVDE